MSKASTSEGQVPQQAVDRVLERITEDEVVELALALGNIDSPTGEEGPVSDYVYEWMRENGLNPKREGLFPDRCNVTSRVNGAGGGASLLYNSHLDTTIAKEEVLTTLKAEDPIYHTGWRDGEYLYGNGVLNNKGLMACWMVAAKALREAGVQLKGDLLLTSVVGEIGLEPVDEFQPPKYIAKEAGARYLVNRGYVADYAIVAEGTDFTMAWVEAGKAFFKISLTVDGHPMYTPYVDRPVSVEDHPNAIVRAAKVIEVLEEWAYKYQTENVYECPGGTVIPKVNVGAIRGGVAYKITKTPSVCHLYLDTRITPVQDPMDVQRELHDVLSSTGMPFELELFVYRRGYEATNVDPLKESITRAHERVFATAPEDPIPPVTSMWRDSNVFIEAGVPTIIYGPGGSVGKGAFVMKAEHLLNGAQTYALTAMDVCGVA